MTEPVTQVPVQLPLLLIPTQLSLELLMVPVQSLNSLFNQQAPTPLTQTMPPSTVEPALRQRELPPSVMEHTALSDDYYVNLRLEPQTNIVGNQYTLRLASSPTS